LVEHKVFPSICLCFERL